MSEPAPRTPAHALDSHSPTATPGPQTELPQERIREKALSRGSAVARQVVYTCPTSRTPPNDRQQPNGRASLWPTPPPPPPPSQPTQHPGIKQCAVRRLVVRREISGGDSGVRATDIARARAIKISIFFFTKTMYDPRRRDPAAERGATCVCRACVLRHVSRRPRRASPVAVRCAAVCRAALVPRAWCVRCRRELAGRGVCVCF